MKNSVREWPVRVEKDFSYGSTAYAGDRWLLVGDAGSFLDPIFSTGVSIALESGLEAAKALERPLKDGRFQRSQFHDFERRQAKRFHVFRRFVIGSTRHGSGICSSSPTCLNPSFARHDDSGGEVESVVCDPLPDSYFLWNCEDPAIHSNRANADPP